MQNLQSVIEFSIFSDLDVFLFRQGKHFQLYDKFGARMMEVDGKKGVYFAVWAPAAHKVYVLGDFNNWHRHRHPLHVRPDSSGIWEGFIPGLDLGIMYKYGIESNYTEQYIEKADPYAFWAEEPPQTASVVWPLEYTWNDEKWMGSRKASNSLTSPMTIYEVHLGSWRRHYDGNSYSYREMADTLIPYVVDMGFTHIEFMPLMAFPYEPSWGYQITGYFAASPRYGTPDDLMYLVDQCHQAGIGVILDWVPSHFPSDAHGLGQFDGTYVYEHPDPRKGYHPDWESLIFNYERPEVRSFLISNALFWLSHYHIDGLRVDAVASMLYLDYSREHGGWEPNEFGGRENLSAIQFIRDMNNEVYRRFPDVQTIAEESTAFPGVTMPVDHEGLGFGMKWMMGWMNDTLNYFKLDPIHRRFHHGQITFSIIYAYSENYVLPLSHDEVVHGKASLLYKMPGSEVEKFSNLRLLFGYMYTHPGSKLLFMGGEFGQTNEWNFKSELNWGLLQYPGHQGIQRLVRALNEFYRQEKAAYELAYDAAGFEWLVISDYRQSLLIYARKGKNPEDVFVAACNFTPVPRSNYQFLVPASKEWIEVLNSDHPDFGGSGMINAHVIPVHISTGAMPKYLISLDIPPLGIAIIKRHA